MRAINRINYYGSIKKTIEAGVLNCGVMYEVVRSGIPLLWQVQSGMTARFLRLRWI